MSEREFELYLSLLSRFLRLKPEQRREIADELRDHFEQRVEELTRHGLSREEAARQAVEEFGDAAGLADHFTRLAQRRKRRLIMRTSLGSVAAALTAIAVMYAVFWTPAPHVNLPPGANAQQKDTPDESAEESSSQGPSALPVGAKHDRHSAVEAKLAKKLPKIELVDTPLKDALDQISDQIEVDILINKSSFQEEGITTDEPVTLVLGYTEISAGTALQLILERIGGLTYTIRDGFIYVQTELAAEETLEIRVYNVRDLLEGIQGRVLFQGTKAELSFEGDRAAGGGMGGGLGGGQRGGLGGGGGFFSVAPGMALRTFGPAAASQYGGGHPPQNVVIRVAPSAALIEVIQVSTSGPWEDLGGTGGTISEFGGLLVVRQTQQMHREIERLLEMLREAAEEEERGAGPRR